MHQMRISDERFCMKPPEQFFSYPAAVTITGVRAANLDLCFALMAFSSEGSFSCHTYCDTGPRFIPSHPKDRQPQWIRTGDARIARSLRLRSNHCATQATSRYWADSVWSIYRPTGAKQYTSLLQRGNKRCTVLFKSFRQTVMNKLLIVHNYVLISIFQRNWLCSLYHGFDKTPRSMPTVRRTCIFILCTKTSCRCA
jgi:hypothetical protein